MILSVVGALLLAAMAGGAVSVVWFKWPRRRTAEEWILHRRAISTGTDSGGEQARLAISAWLGPLSRLAAYRLGHLVRADIGLMQLARQPVPDEVRWLQRLGILGFVGFLGGLVLLLSMASVTQAPPSPVALSLPVAAGLLLPAWSWVSLRRRAAQVRAAAARRLPRSLVAARVLLESGAATPEGALEHVSAVYEDPAAELITEALRLKVVRSIPLEDALEQVAERYAVTPLARLADSMRVGAHHGTPMAELLARQSTQLRELWFANYKERITRAPVTMTIPAVLFFVAPLLVLILVMVFAPLAGWLGQF